jgi:hypothetical protein
LTLINFFVGLWNRFNFGEAAMKVSLQPGVSKMRRIVVDRGRTISFMEEQGRVYATPELCRDIEHTCREALLDHLETGEDSVGIEIMVRHTAPTLPGHCHGHRGRGSQGQF